MNRLNRLVTQKKARPIRVVQFGEGNFLRAFVDYMIDIANEQGLFDGDIVLVKPIPFGSLDRFKAQECQYTVELRGMVDGEAKKTDRIITSVADAVDPYAEYEKYNELAKLSSLRFVVSNTTEAGIVYDEEDCYELCPPNSYPGKLTKFLYTRFTAFQGDPNKGLIILPVELIDDNGLHLKETVLRQIEHWKLGDEFQKWVEEACVFTSTLVDRIVTGYPKDEADEICKALGYQDELIVTGEPFALWVIESAKDISGELPLPEAGLPVIYTTDHHPYKQRKVRILNGAHTSFVPASYLCGNDYVLQSMQDPLIASFIQKTIFSEVIPTLTLPKEELVAFAEAVLERFRNPFVKHAHLSIALNCVSKWKTRCLPSFLAYLEQEGKVPVHLGFSLAALMAFYTGSEIRDKALIGHRFGDEYQILDDEKVLMFFRKYSVLDTAEYVHAVLAHTEFWGQNLTELTDVEETLVHYLENIRTKGMRAAMEDLDS